MYTNAHRFLHLQPLLLSSGCGLTAQLSGTLKLLGSQLGVIAEGQGFTYLPGPAWCDLSCTKSVSSLLVSTVLGSNDSCLDCREAAAIGFLRKEFHIIDLDLQTTAERIVDTAYGKIVVIGKAILTAIMLVLSERDRWRGMNASNTPVDGH